MTTVTTPKVISGLGETAPPSDNATRLKVLELDPRTYSRSLDCVHCGLCLPACPTYTETGLEADSPRGRIMLMKGLANGSLDATESVVEHLDLCLDCRACETACPSGVVYHELIEETRARLKRPDTATFTDKLVQWIFYHLFTYPRRLKLAILPVRLLQRIGLWGLLNHPKLLALLPPQLQKMQTMLPPGGPIWESNLAARYPAMLAPGQTKAKAVVGVFAGCVGSVLFQHVNRQMIALLQKAGCEVVVPKQGCCGAIHHHGGKLHEAEAFAKQNIDAFLGEGSTAGPVDFIVNNISGCGAMLKEYHVLLRDDAAYAEKAKAFVAKVRDVSELLVAMQPPPPERKLDRIVTYHDACHLAHAQKITDPPRALLATVKGLKLIPLRESDMCCGAAGTYNLAQPEMARRLAERKIRHIQATGARICVTANVGCAMQIQSEANRLGVELHVVHPVTLLHEAYFGGGD